MEDLQDTLKVSHSIVSKELARFRPCDTETRCYFCREWAQFVQKKHFSWSARNQADAKPTKQQQQQLNNAHILSAGRYTIKLGDSDDDKIKYKSSAKEVFVNFKSMLKNSLDELDNLKTDKLIQVSEQWIAEPTQLVALPTLFEQVEFDPYDPDVKNREEPNAPAKLLEPLGIDRHHITFPIARFQLLRNLTPDVLQNFSDATCDHTRPEFKTPSELDIERDIYNENLQRELKVTKVDLEQALDKAYSHLSDFISQAKSLEKERSILMGPECQKSIDYFAAKQNIKPFPEYWANFGDLKKQKVPAESIDGYFIGYFDHLVEHVKAFQTDFVEPQLDAACALMEKTWELVVSSVRQMSERKDIVKPGDKDYAELCGAYVAYIDKYNPVEVARANIEEARKDLDARIMEYLPEIAEVMRMYRVESKQTTASRVEKVSKTAFKKLIKKATSGYDSIRQHFRYLMTQKVLSEIRFCACLVVGMEVLMVEVEEVEASVIKREVGLFLESHSEMEKARAHLYEVFREGVATGRTELAGVIGRLILKETMRVQGDSIAKQRQSNLLESLGLPVEEESEIPKKKRTRKKKPESEPEAQEASAASVPVKEPPKKRVTKKAAAAAAAVAAAEAAATTKTKTMTTAEVPITDVPAAEEPEVINTRSDTQASAVEAQKLPQTTSKQEVVGKLPTSGVKAPSIPKDTENSARAAAKATDRPLSKESEVNSITLASESSASLSGSDSWRTPRVNTGRSENTWRSKGNLTPDREYSPPRYVPSSPPGYVPSSPPGYAPSSPPVSKADEMENTTANAGADGWGAGNTEIGNHWNTAGTSKQDTAVEKKQKEVSAFKIEKAAKSISSNTSAAQSGDNNGWNVPGYAAVAARSNESNSSKETGKDEAQIDVGWSSVASDAKASQGWGVSSFDNQQHAPAAVQPQAPPPGLGGSANEAQPTVVSGWGTSVSSNDQKAEGWDKSTKKEQSSDGWGSTSIAGQSFSGWGASNDVTQNVSGRDTSTKAVQNVDGWGSSVNATQNIGGWGASAPSNTQDNTDTWSKTADSRRLKSDTNAEGGWRNTVQKKQPYKEWKDGGARPSSRPSDWNSPGTHWNAYSNDDGNGDWKQSYKRSAERKQNGWIGKNEGIKNNASEGQQNNRNSRVWKVEEKPTNVSNEQQQQQHQEQEQEQQQEIKTVTVSLDSITQKQLPSSQPPGLAIAGTMPSPYITAQPTMLPQQQPTLNLLSVDEIRGMSVELITGMVQNLQQDYNRLYREMELMKITLACQQQQNQLDQARNQTEKEGYIQLIQTLRSNNEALQTKLTSLQQGISYDGAGNTANNGTTAGFGGQDLFSTLRQEITSSHPRHHQQYRRGGKRHVYDKHVNARCSNCGDFNHRSAECTDACRYCNSTDHLSEACQQSQ